MMNRLRSMGRRIKLLIVLPLAIVIGGSLIPAPAEAGLYDRVKDIFELPGEVEELKQEYSKVKESYDESLKQLEEYREAQQKLLEDNTKLMEQNRQLAQTVLELQSSEEARSKQASRWKIMIWTAIALVAGYFAVSRIARYVLRARGR